MSPENCESPLFRRYSVGFSLLGVTLVLGVVSCSGADAGLDDHAEEIVVRESSDLALSAHTSEQHLVFSLLGGLWSVPTEGGPAERLTDVSHVVRDPAWGPEGRRIAFVSVRGNRYALAILEADSSEPLVLFETSDVLSQPAWSPDGNGLAYLRSSESSCEIWTVSANGSTNLQEQLWVSETACQSGPAWTTDGIVFSRASTGRNTSSDLWSITSPEDSPTALVEGTEDQWAPVDGLEGTLLYLERSDTGIALRRHPGGERLVADLPSDVGRPTVAGSLDDEIYLPADGRIWQVAPGGNLKAIPFQVKVSVSRPSYERQVPDVTLAGSDTARGIFAPSLSPDGDRVAFSAMGDIWVMSLSGSSGPRPVITGPAEETMPSWSPDGNRLVYVSNQAGDFDLWVAALDGSHQRRLTDLPGDEREPIWSPDGERIAFSFFDNSTVDLFWIPAEGGEPHRLTEHQTWNWDLSPTWGPEGERLAFLRRTDNRSTPHVALVRLGEKENPTPLDLEELPITALAWSPAGELVYRTGGVLRAALISGNDEAQSANISLGDARAFHPSFDASGRRLLYLSTDGLRLRDWPGGEERRVSIGLEVPGRDAPPPLTIRNVRLIDGTGAAPRGPVDIRIEDGRIAKIAGAATDGRGQDTTDGSSERGIDGSGLTVLPGLIDMHTHMFHYGMRAYLGTGVTTVRDVGFESHLIASRWEGVRSGRLVGPRIVYSGEFLDGPGGPWMGNFVVTVNTPEQVRAEVERLADFGAGWIKTYVQIPPELRLVAIDAAHSQGLPTTQHEIFPAVAHGADGKEHVRTSWKEDFQTILTSSDAWVVPTLETGSGSFVYMRDHPEVWNRSEVTGLLPEYVRSSFRSAVDGADSERVAKMRERHAEQIAMTRRLRKGGARIALGTDPTNPFVLFGVGVHWELEHMVESGYSPIQAIHLATGAAARALGLNDELGTVAPGKFADLLLVEGDPAQDVRDVRRIRWVVFNGELLRPDALYLEKLAEGVAHDE